MVPRKSMAQGQQEIRGLMKDSGWFSKHGQDSGRERGKGRVKSERSRYSCNHHSFI